MLNLSHGLTVADLYSREGLIKLDNTFLRHLERADSALASRLSEARTSPDALAIKQESELLIAVGPHVEDFLIELFGIEMEARLLESGHHELAPLYTCKRLFVQRKAAKHAKADEAAAYDGAALEKQLEARMGESF